MGGQILLKFVKYLKIKQYLFKMVTLEKATMDIEVTKEKKLKKKTKNGDEKVKKVKKVKKDANGEVVKEKKKKKKKSLDGEPAKKKKKTSNGEKKNVVCCLIFYLTL